MDANDLLELGTLGLIYCLVAPCIGLAIGRWRIVQRVIFAMMCCMTLGGIFWPQEWGLTIGNEPDYRGHARGFHFYFAEILAITLIFAAIRNPRTKFQLLPPGLWIWFLYIALSLVSLINAPMEHYVWMAALKATKVVLIFMAAFNFLRDEMDFHFLLTILSSMMIWELVVVLKMKYIDERYQISGTFEHQNALCMFATLIGLLLLAAGAGAKLPGKIFGVISKPTFYLIGFLCSAAVVECTLSRGGIVIFGVGAIGVILWSFYDKISKRRIMVVCVLGAIGSMGLAYSFSTIVARFQDKYNVDSNETRTRLNKASAAMLKDKSLGVGWNNYALVINPPYNYGDVIDEWFIMHGEPLDKDHRKGISESMYWLVLAETGYQGFVAFMAFIGVFLWRNLRALIFFRKQFLACVSAGIFLGCSMNYAHSLLERVLTQPRNMMLWMILLAATAKIEVWRREAKKEKANARKIEREQGVARPLPVSASSSAGW